ncbi:hypothetical protein [Brevibacterium casei]
MTAHTLSPEATGTVGPGAKWTNDCNGADTQSDPLRCEFAGWLGDDLVSVAPDFIVSGTLADALRASDLTGFELRADPVITKSSEFVSESSADFPDRWERIVPSPEPASVSTSEDRGPSEDTDFARRGSDLLVSEHALALLNDHRITHASLTPSGDTAEAERFTVNQNQAEATAGADAVEQYDALTQSAAHETTRITALLETTPATASAAPTMNTQNKRRISGELTRAIAALGAPIDDEKALTVLRLVDGPVAVTDYEIGDRDYLRGEIDGSDLSSMHISLTPDATVRFVQFNFRNPIGDPATEFPRINSLIDGAAPFTRDTVIDLLGDPAKTTTVARNSMIFDEYRISRKRVLFYWDADDHTPQLIVVGRKA